MAINVRFNKSSKLEVYNHLFDSVDDVDLPSVPNIAFSLPSDYPVSSPVCDQTMECYTSSELFRDIRTKMLTNLKQLPHRFSMTALLESWVSCYYKMPNLLVLVG